MPTRLQIARPDIFQLLDEMPTPVFAKDQLARLLNEHRAGWRLARSTSFATFVDDLRKSGKLRVVSFPFPYRPTSRYVWGDVPLFSVLLTLRPECHFSHYTAMQIHNLTEQQPKTIYVNFEQPPKPVWNHPLEQANIDRAFANNQRMTTNQADVEGNRIVMLNGKSTGYLGVETQQVRDDATGKHHPVRVTGIERTLIDIAVRPVYAGGVGEVLKAYQRAADRASLNRLAALLKKLNHVYPYHQAIGFYAEQSGVYPADAIELFRSKFAFDHDFYLTYAMKKKQYVDRWKLYVPPGFISASS
jgi:predicted transcriptional regulator of viral defense system